jgi:endo-alpha-1,4-polygalactosaminidase (GH114 family)
MLAPMLMEFKKICSLIALCLLLGPPAMGEEKELQEMCIPPEAPSIIDGRSAQKQKMLDMRKTVDTFVSDNLVFRNCLQEELKKLSTLKSQKALDLKAYIEEAIEDSLQMDVLVIDTFNTQVRIYKSLEE